MSIPPVELGARVFFDACIAAAEPISEPGRDHARGMRAFLPGDEEALGRLWDRTAAFLSLLQTRQLPLLDSHLRICNGLWFLREDPLSWGAVELARLDEIALSVRWLRDEVAAHLTGQAQGSHEAQDRILGLLAPHCTAGGFALSPAPDSGLARERGVLDAATARFLELERAQREAVAGRLGLSPGRLRSDLTVPLADVPRLEALRGIPELDEIALTGHQAQFRFTPSGPVKDARAVMDLARQRCHALEAAATAELCGQLAPWIPALLKDLEAIGELDVLYGRARWALGLGAVRPALSTDGTFQAEDAVHPVIRDQVEGLGRQYQALSFNLRTPVVHLTGANMGGKTAFLRTVGLLQALFQRGYFIPARSFSAPLVRAMAWVGAVPDAPTLGLSSFGRECRDLVEALALPSPLLLLVDEFARSTDVEEGQALTEALTEHLGRHRQGLFLFAGHQKRLGDGPGTNDVQYLHTGGLDFEAYSRNLGRMEAVEALAASMNYCVLDGPTTSSDALEIALALGLPESLVRSARETWSRRTILGLRENP